MSQKLFFIQSASFNGKPHHRTWVSYEELLQGGHFNFEMGDEPNKSWGTGEENVPFSLSSVK